MTKRRNNFPKRKSDKYTTWNSKAYPRLLELLPPGTRFAEPCAGDGDMVQHLEDAGHICTYAGDIETGQDALEWWDDEHVSDMIITNPPYTWAILNQLLAHFYKQRPTWCLLPLEFLANQQSAHHMHRCALVVPIPRLKWIKDSRDTGTADHSWFYFPCDQPQPGGGPIVRPHFK